MADGDYSTARPADFGDRLNHSSVSSIGATMFDPNFTTPHVDRRTTTSLFDTPDSLLLQPSPRPYDVFKDHGERFNTTGDTFTCTTCLELTTNGVTLFSCSHKVCQECAANNRHEAGVEKLLSPVPPKCSTCGAGKATNFHAGPVFVYSTPDKTMDTSMSTSTAHLAHHFSPMSPSPLNANNNNNNKANGGGAGAVGGAARGQHLTTSVSSSMDLAWRDAQLSPDPRMLIWQQQQQRALDESMASSFYFNSLSANGVTSDCTTPFSPLHTTNTLVSPLKDTSMLSTTASNLSALNLSAVAPMQQAHHLLSPPPPTPTTLPSPLCQGCSEETGLLPATAFCVFCNEFLCESCMMAHQRVNATKQHAIVSLPQLWASINGMSGPLLLEALAKRAALTANIPSLDQMSGSGESSPRAHSVCSVHEGGRVVCICDTCPSLALCALCLTAHPDKHHIVPRGDIRVALSQLVDESRGYEQKCETTLEEVKKAMGRLNKMSANATKLIKGEMARHQMALENRTKQLLTKAENAKKAKKKSLDAQAVLIGEKKASLEQALAEVDAALASGDSDESALRDAFDKLIRLQREEHIADVVSGVTEDERIVFVPPEEETFVINCQLGSLELGPNALMSSVTLPDNKVALCDRFFNVIVTLCDAVGDACVNPVRFLNGFDVAVTVVSPEGVVMETSRPIMAAPGNLTVNFMPTLEGNYTINVTVRGVPLRGCPAQYEMKRGRDYNEIATHGPLFTFGKEGAGDGELCRPWGICIDLLGRVLIADRSNNRIQVFDKEGNFLSKFGMFGNGDGQFDRPAGLTVNTHNHIVVADKDNHRVQVFDQNGNFLHKFGERGRLVGLFNYPWDVATNSQNVIAVSDTRNHRVQMFTEMGQYIRKCGFDSSYFFKNLDSPRGLCYLPDGQLLITDFNNHRMAVLSPRNLTEMKVYGSEGDGCGRFERPQGITTDPEGRILICDSKNNRIQVFASDDMRYIASFGLGPAEPGVGAASSNETFQWQQQAGPFAGPGFQPTPTPIVPSPRQLLDRPTDLAVGPDGRVYVIDFGNNCVRVF